MSHLLDVNRVVFCMRTHKADVDHSVRIIDFHHESVIVALNVEHNTVIAHDARAAVLRLDLRRCVPVLSLNFPVPVEKRIFSFVMTLPELTQPLLGNYPHVKYKLFPERTQVQCSQNYRKSRAGYYSVFC